MFSRFRRLSRDRRGGVTLIAAGSLIALLATTALAVDMGTVYVSSRRLQGAADAAALAAATNPQDANGAIQRTIIANTLARASISALSKGSYTPDASIAPTQRYVAGADPADAAQVTLTQDVPLFFARAITGRATTRIAAKATAVRIDYAAFSIGSRLASVQGGLPGKLLSALTDSNFDLSVMDYNALVGANVDLLAFTDALRTQLHLSAATFGETLDTQVTLPQALTALASVTPDAAAASALKAIALKIGPTTVKLSDLIDLGPYAAQDHADPESTIRVDGYSVLREMLQLASGQRQVALDLGASLPGLTSTKLILAIGQRPAHSPWLAVSQSGDVTVRTAQARLYLDSKAGDISLLGLKVSLHVPILIELAEAQAKLASISCAGGPAHASVSLDVQPAVGSIAIADIDTSHLGDFGTAVAENPVTLANLLLLKITLQAHLPLGGTTWQRADFSSSDIAGGITRTVSTDDLLEGVASGLVKSMNLNVSGIDLSLVTQLVGQAIKPLAPVLDGVIDQVTALLGVHVGQADLRIDGVRCGKPTLVA
jgi:uncharacterized membrane protein